MSAELERVFPGSSGGFQRYMVEQGDKFRTIYPCLQHPYHKLTAFLRPTLLKALPHVLTTRSVHDVLGDYFEDERLKLAFTFQAKYLGMSPWHCPALFSILSFTEYKYGVFHVQGGLNRISHSMADVFDELGGELRLQSPVKQLLHQGRVLSGAELENGERINADAVIVNADYGHAATRLFGGHNVPEEKMRRRKFSCSTFMLYIGLDTIYPDEPHHHILFADDYKANVADIQSERHVSDDMSIYVRNSCVTDPHVAPPGQSGLYILVPTINTRHGFDWENHKEEYADKILERIEQRTGMKDLRSPHHRQAHHQPGRLGKRVHLHGRHLQSRPHAHPDALLPPAQPLQRLRQLLPRRRRHPSRQRTAHHLRVRPHQRQPRLRPLVVPTSPSISHRNIFRGVKWRRSDRRTLPAQAGNPPTVIDRRYISLQDIGAHDRRSCIGSANPAIRHDGFRPAGTLLLKRQASPASFLRAPARHSLFHIVMNALTRCLATYWSSSIGKKLVVAVTGIVLVLFLAGHLIGNLVVFMGPEPFNAYAYFLHHMLHGAGIWIFRIVMLVMIAAHIIATIQLTMQNKAARKAYECTDHHPGHPKSSRYMILSGLTILAFVIYHLLHFTARVGNEYNNLELYKFMLDGKESPQRVENGHRRILRSAACHRVLRHRHDFALLAPDARRSNRFSKPSACARKSPPA